MKKILGILLSVSIGLLFILSAVAKIDSMEPFEYQFVDLGVATWSTAPYIARFLIGIELFLGMLLIFNIALKRFTIKFAVFLLLFFTAYLVFKIITDGNTGNCGCFGVAVKMSPLEGIFKNIFLIASCIAIYFLADENFPENNRISRLIEELGAQGSRNKTFILKHWMKIVIPVLFIAAVCIGFFAYPINAKFISSMDKSAVNYRVPLELMYSSSQQEKPKIDLTKGKHVIAFLSLTCPHCRIAGQKIHVMNKKNPAIPFYLSLNGDKELQKEFFDETHTQNIPHNLFLGPQDWTKVAGISLPVIMFVQDGIVIKKCDGMDLYESDIEAWLTKGSLPDKPL